jgi:chemotaxis protein MotD
LQSSTRLQGVTVTAAPGTPSVAASAIIGHPQPAEAESGAAGDASSRSTGAGTNAAAASDTANQAPPAMPAGPSGRNAGAGADTGSHRRGDDNGQGKPSSAISSSAGSTQATISAAFGGAGGSSTPFLGQTASSFVSGLGTPQSWAAYTSQFAYMANAPAMAAPVRSLSIALQPAELGSVTANLHLSGQQLRIDVEVRTEEAHQRLSSDADEIVKSLRSLGFDVSHVTIRHGGNTPPAAGGANQAAGQGNNAPFQGSGASGGGSGGSATQSNSGQKDADRDSRRPAPQPVGDSRSRGVYI